MRTVSHPIVDDYLRRLEHEARVLPRRDQQELVAEIRSHVETALRPGELVTSVRVPAAAGSAYEKHRHPASGYAVVGVAAVVAVENGRCSRSRVTVGGATASPVNAEAAAEALTGVEPTEDAIAAAAARVAEAVTSPLGDVYASGEYRSQCPCGVRFPSRIRLRCARRFGGRRSSVSCSGRCSCS